MLLYKYGFVFRDEDKPVHRLRGRPASFPFHLLSIFGRDCNKLSFIFILGASSFFHHDLLHGFVVDSFDIDSVAGFIALVMDVQSVSVHVGLDAEPAAANVTQERFLTYGIILKDLQYA